jgi:uncharacterized protein (UPF0264 family)
MPVFDAIAVASGIGARGVMLDTADKGRGSLLDRMALDSVGRFVTAARTRGLLAGVAGALRPAHVAPLLALGPDVIGFRGALCRDGVRGARLDPLAVRRVRALIPRQIGLSGTQMQERNAASVC